jgi:hypothetical protein
VRWRVDRQSVDRTTQPVRAKSEKKMDLILHVSYITSTLGGRGRRLRRHPGVEVRHRALLDLGMSLWRSSFKNELGFRGFVLLGKDFF